MIFPGWFSILDSPGRLFSPVGFKGNRFHYWTYIVFVFDERILFFLFFYFPLLVLKGIDFTTGHIFLYLMKGMSFPGWFSKLDSPGRLFSPVGFKGNRFHYWTYFFCI